MWSKIVFVFSIALLKDVWCEQKSLKKSYSKNCAEVLHSGNTINGIYTIQPNLNSEPFMVLCDMETHGGGWAHIQKRLDGSQNFNQNWTNYKYGFGDLDSEFWLGLENIYQLIGYELNELLVEVIDDVGTKAYAHYEHFSIGNEYMQYSIKALGRFNGTAGDGLRPHRGQKFSTKDKQNDLLAVGITSCAKFFESGWWYHKCHDTNLNGNKRFVGPLKNENKHKGIIWFGFRGSSYGLKSARMLVRPKN